MKSPWNNYRPTTTEIILLAVSFALILWASISLLYKTGHSWIFDSESISNIGDFMSGIVAVCSVFYLIKNLVEQRRITSIQSFETIYIKLLDFWRANTESIKPVFSDDGSTFVGKEVFEIFVCQIENAIDIIKPKVEEQNIENLFTTQEVYNDRKNKFQDNLQKQIIIDIAYAITFVGVTKNGCNALKTIHLKAYNENFINEIINIFRLKLSSSAPQELQKENPNALEKSEILKCDDKAYAGYQHIIGNYFRLLFQAITYVDKQETTILTKNQKYVYAKMARGQMSIYEELALFYNSLSSFGFAWEYDAERERSLITTYKLIKNIPENQPKFPTSIFYPNIDNEFIA